LEALSKKN